METADDHIKIWIYSNFIESFEVQRTNGILIAVLKNYALEFSLSWSRRYASFLFRMYFCVLWAPLPRVSDSLKADSHKTRPPVEKSRQVIIHVADEKIFNFWRLIEIDFISRSIKGVRIP